MHARIITTLPRVLAALTAFVLLIAACGSGGEATAPRQPVAAVRIVPESVEVVVRGTVQLAAATWDASGRAVGHRAVTWASSDPGVATVSATGLVTARLRGSTTVTVTCEDQRATAVVIVFLPKGV
jgi:uncharacterized protein YjdB